MIDLKYLTTNLEEVRLNLKKRNFDISILDKIKELDDLRKKTVASSETIKFEINTLSKKIGELKKAKSSESDLSNILKEVSLKKDKYQEESNNLTEISTRLNDLLLTVPNLIDSEVPLGKGEEDNKVINSWGNVPKFNFEPKDHVTLGENLKLLDMELAAKLSGSRFAFYFGDLAKLERSIYNFFLDDHLNHGYVEVLPPAIVNSETMTGTGQLPKFKEDLFKIEGQESYLISTAEIPLTNVRRDTIFDYKELPFKLTALTPCFRSEAGSYGKDTRGLIRLHQFNKVELVNIVDPKDSEKYHKEMVERAASLLQKLNLAYQEVLLCSFDIGFSSSKTIDLEVWMPSQNKYREISSISNCKNFQSVRAKMRYRDKSGDIVYPHTLNGSGLAVGRTLVAIMENYQNEDGSITVPEVLRSYMGKDKIAASH